MRIAVPYAACLVAMGVAAHAQDAAVRQAPRSGESEVITRFLSNIQAPLTSYRAVRRLEAATRGGRMRATVTAATSFDRERGFDYSILEASGSGLIRDKVLRAALEAERDIAHSRDADRGALTEANYDFGIADTTTDGLQRLTIRPRRKDKLLLEGSVLVTLAEADLVRVEGALVKRPSIWTRRVEIVRRYARIAGIRVPVRMDSIADVLVAGRSTFSMVYEYESINGQTLPIPAAQGSR